MIRQFSSFCFLGLFFLTSLVHAQDDGSVLPFPPTPMASVVKPRLQDSTMKWPDDPQRLPEDAPNILIVMLDDTGFGVSEVFGGEVETPAFKKLAAEGIRYNTFHTTSICSPTRASLLTGRNHTRVGYGTIAERAVAFDGFTGIMPKEAATIAEVLHHYGYKTSAFGKWHNTPATETTTMGPFDRWPTGYGFDHFWGFIAGETSQWEPRLTHNTVHVEPPHDGKYHLTEGMADEALRWLDDHQAFSPDKPFLMYWAPGAVHGPHHVAAKWADKYKGKFDDGWDAYRKRTYQRQLDMGIIPPGTQLTERDSTMQRWDDIPEDQRPFQRRLMEVYAGFVEHTDAQVLRVLDGLESRGLRDNTLVIYIWGDNGSSSEGVRGTISELFAQNQIDAPVEQQLAALNKLGGLDALGTAAVDNMYHAGWAWAGSTPFKGTKLVASYLGGTRNPMVISWPKRIKPSNKMRSQFHHVVDIAPTLYEILGFTPPKVVNGHDQMPFDGVSLAYTFDNAGAATTNNEQFFDNFASRGIYLDGWMASTFGPLVPWDPANNPARMKGWDSEKDVWELYDLNKDFSQSRDLAIANPEKLAEMKARFMELAEDNKDLPIGGAIWTRIHPEDVVKTPYTKWTFSGSTRRMPEFTAPGLGKKSNTVEIRLETDEKASGVLYALGGASAGLTCYMDDGFLCYEYNLFIVERYAVKSKQRIAAGKHTIVVDTSLPKPGAPLTVVISVDGKQIAEMTTKRSAPVAFTASETFDVGVDLGSPVSPSYQERRPFEFDGTIHSVLVELK
jgi:arylsulfatase A-like enzyme